VRTNIIMLISVLLLSALLATPLDAMSSLNMVFPYSLHDILKRMQGQSWLPDVKVKFGMGGLQFNSRNLRLKRYTERKHYCSLGLRMGSHCAYVGPNKGMNLVDLESFQLSYYELSNWELCARTCEDEESCIYWNLDLNGVCRIKSVEYKFAKGQLSGYCTKGKKRTCYNKVNSGMQFVKYSTLTFATEDDCMDECLEDIDVCRNWNWAGGKCHLYKVSHSTTSGVGSGICF